MKARLRVIVRHPWALALVVAAVTFGVGLASHDLGRDEAVTLLVADMPLDRGLTLLAHNEINPPGYYTLMHFWPHGSAWLARLPTYAAALAAVVAIVLAAAHLGISPLHAAALAATAPFLAYYSQEARGYNFLLAFSAVALILTWGTLSFRRFPALALPAVLAGAMYAHYFAAFLVAAVLAALLLWAPRRRIALLVAALTLVLFIPGLVVAVQQLELAPALTGRGWQSLVRAFALIETPHMLLAGRVVNSASMALTVVMVLLTAWGAWLLRRSPAGRFLWLFAGVQVVVPMLIGAFIKFSAPWYLCGALPALLLLAAFALQQLRLRETLLVAGLGTLVIGIAAFGDDLQKPPVQRALAALPAGAPPPVIGGGRLAATAAIYTHGNLSYAYLPPPFDYLGLWSLPPGRPLPSARRVYVFDHCAWDPVVLPTYQVEGRTEYPGNLCVYTEVALLVAGQRDLEEGMLGIGTGLSL
jgi:hypothetical protein